MKQQPTTRAKTSYHPLTVIGTLLLCCACTQTSSKSDSKYSAQKALATEKDALTEGAAAPGTEPGNTADAVVAAEATVGATTAAAGGAAAAPATRDLSQVKVPSDGEATQLVATDFAKAGAGGDVIYADIRHLAQNQTGSKDLEIYRFGLAKALNSVSLNPSIVKLKPIDPAETIFRIKLADFTLSKGWPLIMREKNAGTNSTKVDGATVVEGDWLVYAISRPEIYDPIMNIPGSVPNFESQLNPDYSKASYINITDSMVTFYGRVLQRIPLEIGGKPGGYYWRTYDFAGMPEQTTAFAAPQNMRFATIPRLVAGEFFFSLPNGMQGYYVSGFAFQTRLDAQLFIATDFRRPQDKLTTCVGDKIQSCGYVLNGESCMTCHGNGINMPKTIQGTSGVGSAAEITALLTKDQKRFTDAMAEMGYGVSAIEPINATLAAFRKRTGLKDARVQGGELEGVSSASGSLLKH